MGNCNTVDIKKKTIFLELGRFLMALPKIHAVVAVLVVAAAVSSATFYYYTLLYLSERDVCAEGNSTRQRGRIRVDTRTQVGVIIIGIDLGVKA